MPLTHWLYKLYQTCGLYFSIRLSFTKLILRWLLLFSALDRAICSLGLTTSIYTHKQRLKCANTFPMSDTLSQGFTVVKTLLTPLGVLPQARCHKFTTSTQMVVSHAGPLSLSFVINRALHGSPFCTFGHITP